MSDAAPPLSEAVLDDTAHLYRIGELESLREAALGLARQTRLRLRLFTHDLEASVYDRPEFVEAAKVIALRSPQSRLEILLQSADAVRRDGHRLLPLIQRLPSHVEVRRVHDDYQDHAECLLLADDRGYLRRRFPGRHDAEACFKAPLDTRRFNEFFDEVWGVSEPDSRLRRLNL